MIVGLGWTGAIMAKELTEAGLSVVALERGPDRDTQPDFAYPKLSTSSKARSTTAICRVLPRRP